MNEVLKKEQGTLPMSYDVEKRFSKNLRIWIDKHYPRQEGVLADKLGISTSQLNNLKHGRRSGSESWRRWVADQLGVGYDELIGVSSSGAATQDAIIRIVGSEQDTGVVQDGYRAIPLHETGELARALDGLSLKKGQSRNSVIVSHSELHKRAGHDLRALRVTDDSMWPRAKQGSIIFVDLDDRRFIDDRIYVVASPSADSATGVIRRVRRVAQGHDSRGFLLVSENQRYLPEIADLDWEDLVVGRAVWIWQNMEGAQPEPQYQKTRKIESVEWLASGVAHQLNNALAPILGYGEMALANAGDNEDLKYQIKEMIDASQRAQALGRQLLAFSRQKIQEFSPLDIDEVLRNSEHFLLRPIMPDDVSLHMELGGAMQSVRGDEGQVEQVLINLVNNALDAMPEGGELTIKTCPVEIDEQHAAQKPGTKPGRYVLLSVADTGTGMDDHTLQHLFEPFFTTKTKDTSAGLGLSNCYGIIKQHGGNIWAYSEPGKGSTIEVYLPTASEEIPSVPAREVSVQREMSHMDTAGEQSVIEPPPTILLVEDEQVVRHMCASILRKHDYNVLVAKNGAEAVSIATENKDEIHILLADVILPDISAQELFQQIRTLHPEIGVLYMSAYAQNAILHHGILGSDADFLQKPFKGTDLVARIEQKLYQSKKNPD